jgi:hypothetical protein
MTTDINDMLAAQRQLQQDSFKLDPPLLEGEARADFILWNAYALIDEIGEATDEVKWKPWLTSGRGEWVDRDLFVGELVDAFHFLMNLLLTAGVDGDEFTARYMAKREVNAKRQADGYTGEKVNGRATDEPNLDYDSWNNLTPVQLEHIRRQQENGFA